MSNAILLSETNDKISELKKFKRKLVKSIISDECPFRMGDRVLVRNENDETIMVGIIISIKVVCNSITDYYFSYTIIEYDVHKKQRLKRRLYYEPRCMEMRKMYDLW